MCSLDSNRAWVMLDFGARNTSASGRALVRGMSRHRWWGLLQHGVVCCQAGDGQVVH